MSSSSHFNPTCSFLLFLLALFFVFLYFIIIIIIFIPSATWITIKEQKTTKCCGPRQVWRNYVWELTWWDLKVRLKSRDKDNDIPNVKVFFFFFKACQFWIVLLLSLWFGIFKLKRKKEKKVNPFDPQVYPNRPII